MNKVRKNDKPIAAVLGDFLNKNIELKTGLAVLDIEAIYREKMGSVVSNYTKKISLKNSTLYINVISAPLKSELLYSRKSLMNILNEAIGYDLIKEIKFV
jgi:hypothetical protein